MLYFLVSIASICFSVILTDDCPKSKNCQALSWREWGNCEGTCGKQTTQTRKRTVCFDPSKIAPPITRERVVAFCNITKPIAETRVCRHCLYGKFNITSNACEICKNIKCIDQPCKHGVCYDTPSGLRCDCDDGFSGLDCDIDLQKEIILPSWLPDVEYALLAVISIVILMATGCICMKCCRLCGCMTSDDDDEKKKKSAAYLQPETHSLKPPQKERIPKPPMAREIQDW